jgi:hypothetical protein
VPGAGERHRSPQRLTHWRSGSVPWRRPAQAFRRKNLLKDTFHFGAIGDVVVTRIAIDLAKAHAHKALDFRREMGRGARPGFEDRIDRAVLECESPSSERGGRAIEYVGDPIGGKSGIIELSGEEVLFRRIGFGPEERGASAPEFHGVPVRFDVQIELSRCKSCLYAGHAKGLPV